MDCVPGLGTRYCDALNKTVHRFSGDTQQLSSGKIQSTRESLHERHSIKKVGGFLIFSASKDAPFSEVPPGCGLEESKASLVSIAITVSLIYFFVAT